MANKLVQTHFSQLVFVDVQTKISAVMAEDEISTVIKNCALLAQSAKWLEVPIIATQQYTKALGATVPELAVFFESTPIEKLTFSCMAEPKFQRQMTKDRPQVILAGFEAHICILQTALDLLATGKEVFVVEDAISSRTLANKHNAIQRMRQAGCVITNAESIVFEWLGKAEGDVFKSISRLIR